MAAKIQEYERAALEREQHRAGVERLAATAETVHQEWREGLGTLGFYLNPDELTAWRIKRDTTLQFITRVREAESQLGLLKAKRLSTAALLSGEISRFKPESALNETTEYSHLLQAGLQLKLSAEAVGKERLRLSTVVSSASAAVSKP